ncbi:MAG TPA: hypothetical protein VMD79_07015 [Solirubrobacteraceae bacterium]|nr:hypothetical protein [Solirubrobacteraceae bacterium]
MSAPDESVQPPSGTADAASVLAKLPRTRPQRASARRVAARAHKSPPQPATGAPAATSAPAAGRRSSRAAGSRAADSRATAAPAPRQGFESESERGRTVHPPGGAELVASAAEIVGELAKAGVSAGERLLKDAFSRLPF